MADIVQCATESCRAGERRVSKSSENNWVKLVWAERKLGKKRVCLVNVGHGTSFKAIFLFIYQNLIYFFLWNRRQQSISVTIFPLWLTNRPQFFMFYTLIDHRNDVIKCSNLKPQASGFTAKFWTFYGVISMVYKSVDHGKLWSICFLQWHLLFYEKPKTKQPALCDMLYHVHGLYSHRP